MRSPRPPISLGIDGDDVVEQVGDSWNAFVCEYSVASLRPVRAGSSFPAAVASRRARALFRAMLARARERYSVEVDVRAFAPERVSSGALVLQRRGFGDDVEISFRLHSERGFEPVSLLDPAAARNEAEVSLCVFCSRLRAFDWVDPPVAAQQLRTGDGPQPRLREDVCRDCEDAVLAQCELSRLQVF